MKAINHEIDDITIIHGTDNRAAGVAVWWDLSGVMRRSVMADALRRAGFPEHCLPPTPTPALRLRRAVEAVFGDGRRYVLRGIKKEPMKGGVAVVLLEDDPITGLPAGETVFAAVARDGDIRFHHGGEYDWREESVRHQYDRMGDLLFATDVSNWLSRIAMPHCRAVALRKRGGFYFVPRAYVPMLQTIIEIAGAYDHQFYTAPIHTRASAIEAVLASIRDEIKELTSTIEATLVDRKSRKGLRSHDAKLEAAYEKIAEYERALGVVLDDLREAVEKTRKDVGAALLEDDDD